VIYSAGSFQSTDTDAAYSAVAARTERSRMESRIVHLLWGQARMYVAPSSIIVALWPRWSLLVADRSEAGRRPAASWNLACHLAR